MPKILISSGFGAGWSSLADCNKAKAVAEYQPIINYIENGGDPSQLNASHPLVLQMMKDLKLDFFYAVERQDWKYKKLLAPTKLMITMGQST